MPNHASEGDIGSTRADENIGTKNLKTIFFSYIMSKALRFIRLMNVGDRTESRFVVLALQSLPILMSFAFLVFLTMYVYAIIGLELWSTKYHVSGEHDEVPRYSYTAFASFENFERAMFLVMQLLSTSNWHEVFLAAQRTQEEYMSAAA
eukprot:gene7839-9308_t